MSPGDKGHSEEAGSFITSGYVEDEGESKVKVKIKAEAETSSKLVPCLVLVDAIRRGMRANTAAEQFGRNFGHRVPTPLYFDTHNTIGGAAGSSRERDGRGVIKSWEGGIAVWVGYTCCSHDSHATLVISLSSTVNRIHEDLQTPLSSIGLPVLYRQCFYKSRKIKGPTAASPAAEVAAAALR
ncbi:hypothetical protein BU17DRAFT_62731 [Hysterangium stoloniferum]|nr:hypothetical protein BU17DRAFT_62731 [Hysterangium stoloniferum]